MFFQWFVAPDGRKVGSLKRRVRSHLARWKIAHRCGAKHIWKSKCTKTNHSRTTFGSWDVEKVHAPVARSAFESQNVQNTTGSEHSNMLKTPHVQTTFEGSGLFLRGRCKGFCTFLKVSKTWGLGSISKKRWQAWEIWRGSGKMHAAWQAQYKRHVHHRCSEVRALISWEGLHLGASDLQVC